MKHTFERKLRLPFPARQVFDWHARPGALERLTPPWQKVEVLERQGTIRDGDTAKLRVWVATVPLTWVAEHRDFIDGVQFRDVQVKGPFASWQHTHKFEALGERVTVLTDHIEFAVRGGSLGDAAGEPYTRGELERGFAYRHRILPADLEEQARIAAGGTLTVAVSGASGLIGSALTPFLTTGGHAVKRLVRGGARGPDDVAWNPLGANELSSLNGVDAVVHLAGESLMGQWTPEKKERIRRSRVEGTRNLCEALARLERKPRVLVSASAIGFYGSRGEENLTEESPRGRGFLADLTEAWEAATRPAVEAGIRVVNLRLGVVLDPRGGALAKMLPVFKLGAGGVLASGTHYMSWIVLEDVVSVIYRCLFDESLHGPVNAVAPDPMTNREFTHTLGDVLSRPTIVPVPRFAAKSVFGEELTDEVLLASQRVQPLRLAQAGHTFRFTKLDPALRAVLGR